MTGLEKVLEGRFESDKDFFRACQGVFRSAYPGLKLRWVRIFGRRWAYLCGDSADISAKAPLKIALGQNYGLCIDNSEVIPPEELEKAVNLIKERLRNGVMV